MFALPALLAACNHAPIWQREVNVWGERLCAPSADRLLYAALHRAGLMGRADRRFFETIARPGMTFVDVGANIGLYALLFARLVGAAGRVYAFEPDPVLFAALDRARRLAGREHLHAYPVALGERDGRQRLRRSCFNSGDNRLQAAAADNHGPAANGPEITVARGDDLLAAAPAVDFIKIDVQGWELHALRGLSATIARSPGIQIYLEFWPDGLRAAGCAPADLFRFLEEHGLSVRQERAGRWQPAESCAALEKSVRGHRYINLWAGKLLC